MVVDVNVGFTVVVVVEVVVVVVVVIRGGLGGPKIAFEPNNVRP